MPDWCAIDWAALGTWVEAIALVLILVADLYTLRLQMEERKEQREARKAEREERRQAEIARQRSDVTCAGVTEILRKLPEDEMCKHLWAGQFRHGGFAFESGLFAQLPEYLRKKSDPFTEAIGRPLTHEQNVISRRLLVFRFPYPTFDVVLDDICRLNFGNTILVWDDQGSPIGIPRN